MRRLEYSRKVRSVPFQAKNSAEAVMFLAQIARERRRLEQERACLLRRINRIEVRIGEIGETETRIVPVIKLATSTVADSRSSTAVGQRKLSSTGFTEVTMHY